MTILATKCKVRFEGNNGLLAETEEGAIFEKWYPDSAARWQEVQSLGWHSEGFVGTTREGIEGRENLGASQSVYLDDLMLRDFKKKR